MHPERRSCNSSGVSGRRSQYARGERGNTNKKQGSK